MERPDIQKLEGERNTEKPSVRQFCLKHNLVYFTYLNRLRKLRKNSHPKKDSSFIELSADTTATPFILQFSNGVKLSVEPNFKALSLRRLVATLSN